MTVDGPALLEALYKRWSTSYEELIASFRDFIPANGTYITQQNTPPAVGPDAAVGLIEGFHLGFGVETIEVDNLKMEQIGNRVWTERVDHMVNAKGERFLSIPILGFFDFDDDGTLVLWSDYWDMRDLLALAPSA